MRICSFLPAATEMIYRMGLEHLLVGVTSECDSDKPKVVRSILENKNYSIQQVRSIISQVNARGKSLYYINESLLESIAPDLILMPGGDAGHVDTGYVKESVLKLSKQPLMIALQPQNLAGVFENIITIGRTIRKEGDAYHLVSVLKQRIERLTDVTKSAKAPLRKVVLLEWLDPLLNCGHWIPDMITLAGGKDMLSNPSGHSRMIPWERIVKYDPEIMIIAPCGFTPGRALQEMNKLIDQPGWDELAAARNNTVFLVDGDLFARPGPRLAEGIELLAAILHPGLFSIPQSLSKKMLCFNKAFVAR